MTGAEILFAVLSGLAVNECCDVSPWIARKLIRWSAGHRYADPVRAEIRAEELARVIEDRPGKLFKLLTALAFVTVALAEDVRHAFARHVPKMVTRLTRKSMTRVPADAGSRHGFWDILTATERADLGARGRHRVFAAGTAIFRERDSSAYVLIIMSGWVKASVASPEGNEVILGVRGPGDMVGERAALWNESRSADVHALDEVRALMVRGTEFVDFLDRHRNAERALIRVGSNRLDESLKRLRLLGSAGGGRRLAALLLELAERHGTRTAAGTTTVSLPLTRDDLAGWCGCSPRTVSGALRRWARSGAVAASRRRVTVVDADALRDLAVRARP